MFVTAKDALDRLTSYLGQDVGDAATRSCQRAIQDSLREMGLAHRWSYLISELLFTTSASQNDGTIAYDAATRRVTLTSDTWPTWAQYGVIILPPEIHTRVFRRISSTVIELDANSAPSEDIAAGGIYTLYRDLYDLPVDFHEGSLLVRSGSHETLEWINPQQWQDAGSPYFPSGSHPNCCTFLGRPEGYGRVSLAIAPYPTVATNLRMMYKRLPRLVQTWNYTDGTITGSLSGTTLTGSGTAWTAAMVGSIIRLTSSTQEVPSEFANPPTEEFRIIAVDSATSLTIDGTLANAYAATKYIISDPIDIDYATMLGAFWFCCYKNLANIQVVKDKPNASILFDYELKVAKATDMRSMQKHQLGSNYTQRWWP